MTMIAGRSRSQAAVAGAVATMAAMGASELAAALLSAQSLVAAIGGAVIDLQPAGAKDFVVALFGQNDKLALELFIVVVAIGVGAVLGLVARRAFMVGAAGFVTFAVIGFVAALSDPSAAAAPTAIVAAVAAIVGIQVLSWLLGPPQPVTTTGPADDPNGVRATMPDWSRRNFLLKSGSVAVASVVAGVAGRRLARGRASRAVDRQRHDPAGRRDRDVAVRLVARDRRPHPDRRPERPTSTGSTRRSSPRVSTSRRGASESTAWSTAKRPSATRSWSTCR